MDEHGGVFKTSYGWAAPDLEENPSRRAVIDAVGLERYRPFFAFASDTVHGGSKGTQYRLGLTDDAQDEMLLVGPSNIGFTDPAQFTALMLMEVTESLLEIDRSVPWQIVAVVLAELTDEVARSFDRVRQVILMEEMERTEGDG